MSEKTGVLHLEMDGKIRLNGVLLQCTPVMRENIFHNFSEGERVKVEFFDGGATQGYVKNIVLVGVPNLEGNNS